MKLNIYNWSYDNRHPKTAEELTWCMRDLRDVLLKESDWVLSVDSPLSDDLKKEWIVWRQWMRDITEFCFPVEGDKFVVIPNPPKGAPASWVNVEFKEDI